MPAVEVNSKRLSTNRFTLYTNGHLGYFLPMDSKVVRVGCLAAMFILVAAACSDSEETSPANSAQGGSSGQAGSGGGSGSSGTSVEDRKPGERAPLTAACDDSDPTRCLLPWPSNRYTRSDSTTETQIRLAIDASSLPGTFYQNDGSIAPDDPSYLNLADGFSRLSELATAFDGSFDSEAFNDKKPLKLFNAQPDHTDYGKEVTLDLRALEFTKEEDDITETLFLGTPQTPLAAAADHVAVMLDDLKSNDGKTLEAPRAVKVSLALVEPENDDEKALRAYHAPTRKVLESAKIDFSKVLRVWDFTTRSATDITKRLVEMRNAAKQAVKDGEVEAVIDSLETKPDDSAIAYIILGRLTGIPNYLNDETKKLYLDENGAPVRHGTREGRFRIMVPKGTGDYRTVLFGHGTGGEVTDGNFDEDLAALNIAKVNLRFDGWTESEVIKTFTDFNMGVMKACHASTSQLVQAVANGAAIQESLRGPMADLVSAPMINGMVNPTAGRKPDMTLPIWAGGSMGGTMGFVIANVDDEIRHAVLNVPGAAWTRWIPDSDFFNYIGPFLHKTLEGDLNVRHEIVMTQTAWDDIDGAAWLGAVPDDNPVYLIQESIEDTVIPNHGTAIIARSMNAVQVGPPLLTMSGLEQEDSVANRSGLTQYKVPPTGQFDIHGFAACKSPAGEAARSQIYEFFVSTWAGETTISFPEICVEQTDDQTCDFTGMWTYGCSKI